MYKCPEETRALVDLIRGVVKDPKAPLDIQMLRGEKLTCAMRPDAKWPVRLVYNNSCRRNCAACTLLSSTDLPSCR